jgi:hypothetical protein
MEKQQTIGLIERLSAFDALRSENSYVGWASGFLRIFLILIDCTPVILKILMGATTYDTLIERRRQRRQREFLAEEGIEERERLAETKERGKLLDAREADDRARADSDERQRIAEESVAFRRQITSLRDQILRGARSSDRRRSA